MSTISSIRNFLSPQLVEPKAEKPIELASSIARKSLEKMQEIATRQPFKAVVLPLAILNQVSQASAQQFSNETILCEINSCYGNELVSIVGVGCALLILGTLVYSLYKYRAFKEASRQEQTPPTTFILMGPRGQIAVAKRIEVEVAINLPSTT